MKIWSSNGKQKKLPRSEDCVHRQQQQGDNIYVLNERLSPHSMDRCASSIEVLCYIFWVSYSKEHTYIHIHIY